MRSSGRHYRDFLNGIDNLHETMRFSYPRMSSPFFRVSDEDNNGCLLHYQSKRVGFTRYVIGQLIQSARSFYDVSVDVVMLDESIQAEGCKATFRLNFDNSNALESQKRRESQSLRHGRCASVSGGMFFKVSDGPNFGP